MRSSVAKPRGVLRVRRAPDRRDGRCCLFRGEPIQGSGEPPARGPTHPRRAGDVPGRRPMSKLDTEHPEWTIQLEAVPRRVGAREGHQPARRGHPPDLLTPGRQRPAVDPPSRVRRPHRSSRRRQSSTSPIYAGPSTSSAWREGLWGHPGQRLARDRLLQPPPFADAGLASRPPTRGPSTTCGRLRSR